MVDSTSSSQMMSALSPTHQTEMDPSGVQQQQLHYPHHQGYYYQQHASIPGHPGWMASSPPTLSHMDMARPPHEGLYFS